MPAGRLPRSHLTIYALPAAGLGFMQSLIQFYLMKFSTDVLLLSPALMGVVLGVGRVWDGTSDPLAGYWSDRTQSRLGRRRPWLLAAALPLGLCFAALWQPPQAFSAASLALWIAAALLLFESAMTAVQIPHLALAAELTDDGRDRNRVFGARLAWTLGGFLLGALALGHIERSAAPRQSVAALAALAGLVAALLCVLCGAWLREPRERRSSPTSSLRAFGDVLRNRQARCLVGVIFLEAIGFATLTTSMAYASEYVFERRVATSTLLSSALLASFASVPLWLWAGRRFARRRLWLASLAGRAVAFGLLGQVPATPACLVASTIAIGTLFGAGRIFGPAVQADVIDAEARRSGEHKQGTFFAALNLVEKCAEGGAVVVAGAVLALSGFQPNAPQHETARLGIRALNAALPCLFSVAAALLLARFPRTES